jgi:hypothetical protein
MAADTAAGIIENSLLRNSIQLQQADFQKIKS